MNFLACIPSLSVSKVFNLLLPASGTETEIKVREKNLFNEIFLRNFPFEVSSLFGDVRCENRGGKKAQK